MSNEDLALLAWYFNRGFERCLRQLQKHNISTSVFSIFAPSISSTHCRRSYTREFLRVFCESGLLQRFVSNIDTQTNGRTKTQPVNPLVEKRFVLFLCTVEKKLQNGIIFCEILNIFIHSNSYFGTKFCS